MRSGTCVFRRQFRAVANRVGSRARIASWNCRSRRRSRPCCPAPPTLARRRGMAVRAQVGRLSNAGVSRRRRDPTAEPRREAHEPILPRAHRPTGRHAIPRCVIDGEIVIVGVGGLDFEALLLRIHPAASRVKLLSAQAPASFVAWDLLALGDDDLRNAPLAVRRERLEQVLAGAAPPVHLSPATRDRALAADWFRRFEGAGLDGVMAKRLDAPYRAGERTMIKVKHERTADCLVAGFRWHKKGAGHDDRLAPARPVRRRSHAPPCRGRRGVHGHGAQAARRRADAAARRTRSKAIHGGIGPWHRRKPARRDSGCPARPAGGTAGKI